MQGAQYMIQNGCLDDVCQVWAFHNRATEPKGGIYARNGPFLGASMRAYVTFSAWYFFLFA